MAAAVASAQQATEVNMTVCLRSTPGYGLENLLDTSICTLLPSNVKAVLPWCDAPSLLSLLAPLLKR